MTNYYVSLNGNDTNPGTLSQPWRTLQKASVSLVPGDTINVRGGTYNISSSIAISNKLGDANHWTTFAPYNNESVIIDGNSLPVAWGSAFFEMENVSYIHITGFRMQNSPGRGITINSPANHITIDYNTITNCSVNGILSYTADNILVQHNIVDFVNNNWAGNGINDEGISFATVSNFDISYNTLSRCGKECIDAKVGSYNGNIHHNNIDTSTWVGDPGYLGQNPYNHIGIYCDAWNAREHDINIYDNYIHGDHGNGIVCGAEVAGGSIDNIRIYNNVIDTMINGYALALENWVEQANQPTSNIYIYDNTIISNGSIALNIGSINIVGTNTIVINNNIIFSRAAECVFRVEHYAIADNKVSLSNNLFFGLLWPAYYEIIWSDGGFRHANNPEKFGTNPIFTNPQFMNNASDYHLQPTSPARNTGTSSYSAPTDYDGVSRPQPPGGNYDIGAYEYVEYIPSGIVDDTETFIVTIL